MNGSLPTISLVTPSFNQAEYLERTMDSVLDQRYPALEYIVVDAGSTDGSVEMIRRREDKLATWVSEADDGHTDGINKGFARSSGEIMGWINSSDLHLPWTLQCVGEIFRDVPRAQWIMGLQTQVSSDGTPRAVGAAEWNVWDFLAGNYRWLQQESVFWRRSLWEDAGGRIDPAVVYAGDFWLWLAFMRLAPLYHAQVPLGGFRHHDVRRGTVAGGPYEDETAALWRRWRDLAPAKDRRRARLIHGGTGRRGRIWRDLVEASGLAPWYRHPRIVHDFDSGRWVVA